MKLFSRYIPCLLSLLGLAVSPAQADLLYSFDFTPTATITGNTIQGFDFSFTSPDFITAPGTLSFAPFDISDGTYSVEISFGEVLAACPDSFEFSTSSSQLGVNCNGSTGQGQGVGFLNFSQTQQPQLPTTTGEYTLGTTWEMGTGLFPGDLTFGSTDLTIAQTSGAPEPSGFVLLASGLFVTGWRRRGRKTVRQN